MFKKDLPADHQDDPQSSPPDGQWPSRSFPPASRRGLGLHRQRPPHLPRQSLYQRPLDRQPLHPYTPHGALNLKAVVKIAHEEGHSDIHLGVGELPRYRARGEMQTTEWPATDLSTFQGWLQEILSPQQIDAFFGEKEFDSSLEFPFVSMRINLLDSLRGPAMVLRLIPQTILTMEQLKLSEVLTELAGRPKGLILVTGPTGSGKSTTLAAMIDWIKSNETRNILTIEDPVEFVHESKRSLIRHQEVGMHTLKFHNALRAALREDPDVILVGGDPRPGNPLHRPGSRPDGPPGHRHRSRQFGGENSRAGSGDVSTRRARQCAAFHVGVAAGSDRPGNDPHHRRETGRLPRHTHQHGRLQWLHQSWSPR